MASRAQLVSSRSQVVDLRSLSLSWADIGPTITQYISTTDHGATEAAASTVKAALEKMERVARIAMASNQDMALAVIDSNRHQFKEMREAMESFLCASLKTPQKSAGIEN